MNRLTHAIELGSRAVGLYPVSNRRVPHISLVFREMWDTAGLPLKQVEGYINCPQVLGAVMTVIAPKPGTPVCEVT